MLKKFAVPKLTKLILSLFIYLLLMPVTPAQNLGTRILLNDQLIQMPLSPFVQNSVLYLPIQIVEQLGFSVYLDPLKHQARLVKPGSFYQVTEGSRQITWQGQGLQISQAPIWQQGTLFIPRSMFVNLGVLLSYSMHRDEVRLTSDLNHLNQAQVNPTDVYTRLLFEFSQEPSYRVTENGNLLTIDVMGIETDAIETLTPETHDPLIKKFKIQKTGPATCQIQIEKAYKMPHKLYWLKDPHRLVIDLVKIFQEDQQSSIAPGVNMVQTYQGLAFGPVSYTSVEIQKQANVHLEPALAGNQRGFVKETVSQMARRKNAILGINGGYFSHSGVPLGTLLLNRELISSPFYGRTMLGFLPQNRLFIDQGDRSASVFYPQLNRTMAFHGINLPRQNNQAILYSPRFGLRTGTPEDENGFELQIALDGTVTQIGSHNLEIPEDGYVISVQGQAAPWLKEQAYIGMRALVFSKVWEKWAQAQHLLGGGPLLLKAGQINVTAQAEKFQPDIAQGRAPRTALGLKPNGDILLIVVDGRQQNSRGLSLQELASLMKEKGAVEAMNFDGGGSSALVVKNKLINSPSDGHERPVATALLLMPNAS